MVDAINGLFLRQPYHGNARRGNTVSVTQNNNNSSGATHSVFITISNDVAKYSNKTLFTINLIIYIYLSRYGSQVLNQNMQVNTVTLKY